VTRDNTDDVGDDDDNDDDNNTNNNNNNIAAPLTFKLPKTEAQKVTKYENLAMDITNM
jgi:hypothetical protein